MRYLKTYKLFENQSDIPYELWDDISDILIELEDEGFATSKHFDDVKKVSNKLCEDVIEIVVNKQSTEDFSYTDIEEVFKRLIDYLTPYGWNYSILYFGKFSYIEFECDGEHTLAKLDGRNIERTKSGNDIFNPEYQVNDFEMMMSKQQLEKILKECQAFKIVFYQNIDHIIKENKIFESYSITRMRLKYGESVLSECDDMIGDIKDMVLELGDIGLFTRVGYTPMTISSSEKTPKIIVEVQGDSELCESNEDDINSTFERIKDYVRSKGYPTGFGNWEREAGNGKNISVYMMLIQK